MGKTPLSISIWRGHDSIAFRLLNTDGVDSGPEGCYHKASLLILAIEHGREAIMNYLLEVGDVDIELRNNNGYNALELAILHKNSGAARLFARESRRY